MRYRRTIRIQNLGEWWHRLSSLCNTAWPFGGELRVEPKGCATIFLLCLCLVPFSAPAFAAAPVAPEAEPELRTREIYVPYDEFLKLAGKDPNATLMTLEEYRALVALATAQDAARRPVVLPPLKAVLAEAVYRGRASETAVRFDATFEVSVTEDPWVRCDLGPAMPGLGSVTLDGHPAWVVLERGRAYLILKGVGRHAGTLSFTMPIRKDEDLQKLEGPLLAAATSVAHLDVPGRATPEGASGVLETAYDEGQDATHFTLALGGRGALALAWRRKFGADRNEALLRAEQQISYLLERASPGFRWAARVSIARRKTAELLFIEPPGGRVVKLAGPQIHSWTREGNELRVLLNRALVGEVELLGEGIVPAGEGPFELGCPALKAASQDTRCLALWEAGDTRLAVDKAAGFQELALNERSVPVWNSGRLTRLFLLQTPGAKLTAQTPPRAPLYDTQAMLSLSITERDVTLRAVISLQVEQGRLYRVPLHIPAEWTLVEAGERGTGRGLQVEETRSGDERAWDLRLREAADERHPLELDLLLRLRDPAWADAEWESRPLRVATPALGTARRTRTQLGIRVHPFIEMAFAEMPAWRTKGPGQVESLGLPEAMLRAALETDVPGSAIQVNLTRKRSRGEYEGVTHLLTFEREMWVRTDIRLAVVDRAVDELVLKLPPGVQDPLQVSGHEIKELAPGASADRRRIRFNRPWHGVRMLRVEYRVPLEAGLETPVPDVRLEGEFDSRRRIVFQSARAVKLTVTPDAGMALASLEENPEFASAFTTGRALFAYSFRAGGAPGTFRTELFERSETLGSVVASLDLTTLLDASGLSRTHAAFDLRYAREQYISVRLPEGARILALAVAGKRVRPVASAAADVHAIPLPPHTQAQVELVYERMRGPLGAFGSWEEAGPEPLEIPVGKTTWRVFHSDDYAFAMRGGNLTSPDARGPEYFAQSFWQRLFSGAWPRWTAWEPPAVQMPAPAELSGGVREEARHEKPEGSPLQALASREALAAKREDLQERSIRNLAIPEGVGLKAGKLGGAPLLVLAYRKHAWSRFAARAVFFGALLAGLWLALKRPPRSLLIFLGGGLLLGTLLPPALQWSSPTLWVPFCEGLSLAALVVLVAWAGRGLRWLRRRNRDARSRIAHGVTR